MAKAHCDRPQGKWCRKGSKTYLGFHVYWFRSFQVYTGMIRVLFALQGRGCPRCLNADCPGPDRDGSKPCRDVEKVSREYLPPFLVYSFLLLCFDVPSTPQRGYIAFHTISNKEKRRIE